MSASTRRTEVTLWLGVLIVVLAASVFAAWSTILQAAGDFLAVRDPLQGADAVIVISGNNPERVRTASRLFREGYASWMIVSGAGRSVQEMIELAESAGVPTDRILVDDNATSTWENAIGCARVMRDARLHTAILVTSPYHMRRAVLLFRRAFAGSRLVVNAYPVPDSMIDMRGWWRRPRDREFVLRELVKLGALLVGIR